LSSQKGVPSNVILQDYFFDAFLKRLAKSQYVENFVFKGGFLLSATYRRPIKIRTLDNNVCSLAEFYGYDEYGMTTGKYLSCYGNGFQYYYSYSEDYSNYDKKSICILNFKRNGGVHLWHSNINLF
jgi:hypothetical protein